MPLDLFTLKFALHLVGFALLGVMVYLVLKKGEHIKTICVAATVSLFLGNLDVLKSFRLGASGVEAETREAVREARVTIDQTRISLRELGRVVMYLLAASGLANDEYEAMKGTLKAQLETLGLSVEDIQHVMNAERPMVEETYAYYIITEARSDISRALDNEQDLRELKYSIDERRRDYVLTPEEIEQYFDALGVLTEKRKRLLDDFRHYKKTGQQRRPEVWKDRYNWSRRDY